MPGADPREPEVLERAAALVERGWTQGAYATVNGIPTDYADPDADSFCATGACMRAAADVIGGEPMMGEVFRLGYAAIRRVSEVRNDARVARWNDSPATTVREVATTLRSAAKHATRLL